MHSSPTSSKFISRRWERNWPTYSSSSLPSPFKNRNVNDEEQCDFDRGIALSLYQVYLSQQGSIESINVFPYQCWIKDFRNETNLSSSGNEMDKKKRNLFRTRFAYNYVSLCMYIARKSIWPDHWFQVSGNVSPLFSLYPFLYYPLGSRRRIPKILGNVSLYPCPVHASFLPSSLIDANARFDARISIASIFNGVSLYRELWNFRRVNGSSLYPS